MRTFFGDYKKRNRQNKMKAKNKKAAIINGKNS